MSSGKARRSAAGAGNMDSETTYTVEKILKRRMKGGRMEYFVKWQGYASSDNSWEPEENFVEVRH
jgi:hypothetical protein